MPEGRGKTPKFIKDLFKEVVQAAKDNHSSDKQSRKQHEKEKKKWKKK